MKDAELNQLERETEAAWLEFQAIDVEHRAAKDKWFPLYTQLEKERARRLLIAEMQASGELPKPEAQNETHRHTRRA